MIVLEDVGAGRFACDLMLMRPGRGRGVWPIVISAGRQRGGAYEAVQLDEGSGDLAMVLPAESSYRVRRGDCLAQVCAAVR